jgi:hypothetical protein
MLPVNIQDYISKLLDKKTHPEGRQFYYATLMTIKTSIENAIDKYETEKRFKK